MDWVKLKEAPRVEKVYARMPGLFHVMQAYFLKIIECTFDEGKEDLSDDVGLYDVRLEHGIDVTRRSMMRPL